MDCPKCGEAMKPSKKLDTKGPDLWPYQRLVCRKCDVIGPRVG